MSCSHVNFGVVGLILVLGCQLSVSQTYPDYQDLFVNDYAGIISDTDEAQIRNLLRTFKAETGTEVTVLTIDSFRDYGTSDFDIETFATNLFNTWGIGDASKNDGVLILVAYRDREMRIELGRGYSAEYNRDAKIVIDEYMTPQFIRDDYSYGIVWGTQKLIDRLSAPPVQNTLDPSSAVRSSPPTTPSRPTPSPPTSSSPSYRPRPTYSPSPSYGQDRTGVGVATLAGVFASMSAALFAWRRRQRYKPRDCQNCGYALERLNEIDDDVYLDDGQLVEEYLYSVDYDVWKCHNCNEHELHPYPALFSGYSKCPSCTYRTLETNRTTLVAASCHSGGREEITEDCRNDKCRYTDTRVVNTPVRDCSDNNASSSSSSFSSASSSSGFGGGSSSGGGSSGSW